MQAQAKNQTKDSSSVLNSDRSGILQRKCESCGQHTIGSGECAGCSQKRLPLQRRATNNSELQEIPPVVHEVLRSPGQPLDRETRNFTESSFTITSW